MSKREIIKKLILRQPRENLNRLHPQARKRRNQYSQPLEPLKYKLQDFTPKSPYEKFQENTPAVDIPFLVNRSFNGNLPIYRKYYYGQQEIDQNKYEIEGDIEEFQKELAKVTSNAPQKLKMGSIEIVGSHKMNVEKWLQGLGF